MRINLDGITDNIGSLSKDQSILSGMLQMCDGFLAGEIKRIYSKESWQKLLCGSKEEREKILMPYDGYTWESVFANLKCHEIHGFIMSDDKDKTNGLYMSYLERLHNLDMDGVKDLFSADSQSAIGAIYAEVWEIYKDKVTSALLESGDKVDLFAIAKDAMNESIPIAFSKYKELLKKAGNDDLSVYSSMMTKTGDIYSQILKDPKALFKTTYASSVKAAEVLVCNPECLPFGERIVSALKYILTGASVYAGKYVGEMLREKKEDVVKMLGEDGINLASSFVSSALSYIMIIQLDRNTVIQKLIERFNMVPTITGDIGYYRQVAEQFEAYAAELENLDIEKLKKDIEECTTVANDIEKISSAEELNKYLIEYYKNAGIDLPWGNMDFEDYWASDNRQLVFN